MPRVRTGIMLRSRSRKQNICYVRNRGRLRVKNVLRPRSDSRTGFLDFRTHLVKPQKKFCRLMGTGRSLVAVRSFQFNGLPSMAVFGDPIRLSRERYLPTASFSFRRSSLTGDRHALHAADVQCRFSRHRVQNTTMRRYRIICVIK